ncbi:MAG: AraC family transcriptional regulator ligand-binding domain-containing protein [Pseudomonadota bacterium]
MAAASLVTAFALGPAADVIERHAGWRTVERSFKEASIPLDVIEERRLYIPYAGEATLIECAAREMGDANLALHIGRAFPFKELGVYGRYVVSAPTLLSALTRALRGLRYATNTGTFSLDIGAGEARISYSSGIEGQSGVNHIHAGTLLLITDLIRQYAGSHWKPIRVELDQAKGPNPDAVEELFEAPVVFGRKLPAVIFELSLLHQPNRQQAPGAKQLILADLRQMVLEKPRNDIRSVVESVLQLRLLDGMTDIDGTSEILGLGSRTLQRQLQSHGVAYRDLVDAVRRKRASALLLETTMKVSEIALALGYSTSAHFIRAFQRWTGTTPNAFRTSLSPDPAVVRS